MDLLGEASGCLSHDFKLICLAPSLNKSNKVYLRNSDGILMNYHIRLYKTPQHPYLLNTLQSRVFMSRDKISFEWVTKV